MKISAKERATAGKILCSRKLVAVAMYVLQYYEKNKSIGLSSSTTRK